MQLVWPCSLVLTALVAVMSGNSVKTTWTDLNDPATLSCLEPCSGVETWERNGLKVAKCGGEEELEFSCERHLDQSSLTVPQVNYTTRGFYHTKCDGKVICFQNLQPRSHSSSVEVPAGDLLILDLLTFHSVTLTFSQTDEGSATPVEMCTVDGRSVRCKAGYEDRVSVFGNSMVLRDVVPADSGVYMVREINDGAALVRKVSVTVKGETEVRADREASREEIQLITLILTGSKNDGGQTGVHVLTVSTVVLSVVTVGLGIALARAHKKTEGRSTRS